MRWSPLPDSLDELPSTPGSYILEFVLSRQLTIHPGRLGPLDLNPGRLRYYGSARGSGGLKARIRRHTLCAGRKAHWHLDALTSVVTPTRVATFEDLSECELLSRDLGSGVWVTVRDGFGSSDCRSCPAHLLHHPDHGR